MCGNILSGPKSLYNHIRLYHAKHDQCKCEICGQQFETQTNLNTHRKSVHSEHQECELFGLKFADVKEHKQRIHSENYTPPSAKQVKKSKCDICKKSFNKLTDHKRAVHNKEQVECKDCSRTFAIGSIFRHRKRFHENEEWSCELCQKVCCSREDYFKHINAKICANK